MRARGTRFAGFVLLALLGLVGCSGASYSGDMRYQIAGGGPSGLYYNYGGGLAEVLQQELGIDIEVIQTEGSVDNLLRVDSEEAILGFAQGDTAVDAIAGEGAFDEPLSVQAVARVYDEYVHIVVPADSELEHVSDLKGRRVSLGARGSGVQVIATRVLHAFGVDLGTVENPELPLSESIDALQSGEIDGFFWVGGLPTPGVEALAKEMPLRLLSIEPGTVERVNSDHVGVYRLAEFPVGVYGIESSSVTMTVPNYLITSADAPDALIRDVTRELFDSRTQLARRVSVAELLDRRQAIFTGPMELHPGAVEFYHDARR